MLSGATRNAPLSRKTARGGSRGRFTANKIEWTPRLLYNFPRATRERGPVAPAMHPFREKRVSRGGEPVFPRIKENGRHDFYVTLQRASGIADGSAPQCILLETLAQRAFKNTKKGSRFPATMRGPLPLSFLFIYRWEFPIILGWNAPSCNLISRWLVCVDTHL